MDRNATEKRKQSKFLTHSLYIAFPNKRKNSLQRIFLIPFLAFFFIFNTSSDQVDYFKTENGLRVILHSKPGLTLLSMVFAINYGSKDETKKTSGQSHLLEHLLVLSATKNLKKLDLITRIRGKGMEINAHTDHDLMTIELSTPRAESEFALRLLMEKAFALNPNEQDLADEKIIVLEEINQIKDNPIRLGTLSAFQQLFQDHPYEYPLYGNKKIIFQTELKDLMEKYSTYFVPSNCSLAIVGDFQFEDMKNKVIDAFGRVNRVQQPQQKIKKPQVLKKNKIKKIKMDINQAHLIMGFSAPEFNHPDHFAVEILTHSLGKGSNPLLGMAVRGKKILAETFSMRYISLKMGGIIIIRVTTKPKNLRQLQNQILRFLKKSNSFRYAKEDFLQKNQIYVTDYLQSAKNKIKLNAENFKELGLNRALTYARFILLNDESKPFHFQKSIKNVNSKDLREAASKYLCGKKCAIVTIVPEKKK